MSEVSMLINEYPTQALRNCFHFSDGTTDTKRAAEFFHVSQRTVQHWITTDNMPQWAVTLLFIHYRGYLPYNPEWQGFHIQGNALHYNSHYGPRSITPKQLQSLDFALTFMDRKDNLFWDEYAKARKHDDKYYEAKHQRRTLQQQIEHLEWLLSKETIESKRGALTRRIDKLNEKLKMISIY